MDGLYLSPMLDIDWERMTIEAWSDPIVPLRRILLGSVLESDLVLPSSGRGSVFASADTSVLGDSGFKSGESVLESPGGPISWLMSSRTGSGRTSKFGSAVVPVGCTGANEWEGGWAGEVVWGWAGGV